MKKFWHATKKPLVYAIIATVLCVIDALIGEIFVVDGVFMWVGLVFWLVFPDASIGKRFKLLLGAVVGFFVALLAMYITSLFTVNLSTVSLSALLATFAVSLIVMYLEKVKFIGMSFISSVFVGITLTYSGLGYGLYPLASQREGLIMLYIIITYGVLGLLCGLFANLFTKDKSADKIPADIFDDLDLNI